MPVLARTGRELLYGRNAVLEALRGRRSIERLFIAEGAREDERLRGLMALATERGAEIDRIPRMMLDDATRGANHQGIALEAEPYRYAEFEDLLAAPGTILVLDHLQDPQNVGTLFRAAEAAGVAGVVIPADRAAAVTPAVVNASAGAVEHLRVAAVPNLARALEALQGSGRWVAGLRCRFEREQHLCDRDSDAGRARRRSRRRWAGSEPPQALRSTAGATDARPGRLAQRRDRRRDRDLRAFAERERAANGQRSRWGTGKLVRIWSGTFRATMPGRRDGVPLSTNDEEGE